jgi:hypothetical protein
MDNSIAKKLIYKLINCIKFFGMLREN